jgi:hypothetical protein
MSHIWGKKLLIGTCCLFHFENYTLIFNRISIIVLKASWKISLAILI